MGAAEDGAHTEELGFNQFHANVFLFARNHPLEANFFGVSAAFDLTCTRGM
jgi:hypothetical protein